MVKQLLKRIARRVFGGNPAPKRVEPVLAPAPVLPSRSRPPEPAHRRRDEAAPRPPQDRRDARPRGGRPQGPIAEGRGPGSAPSPRVHAVPAAAPAAPWALSDFVVPPKEGATRFHDFELPLPLMRAVHDLGFQYCTPIQAKVLGPALLGQHIMGQAQTGTGKTAAFLISVFTQFLRRQPPAGRRPGAPRALVLAPTRELCIQIGSDAEALGKYTGFHMVAVYGGMDFDRQARALNAAPVDVIAATPGRLLDFIRRGVIDLRNVESLVIDEADRMLDMGFIPDVKSIIRRLPPTEARQTLLFSATLTEDVRRLAAQWMKDPVVVDIAPEQVAVDTVKQLVFAVSSRDKFTVLYNLLQQPELKRVLIFGNRRDSTMRLAEALQRHGVDCGLLSGAIDQKKRVRILEDFKHGRVRVLVATDVAGRGLHVDEITHVINFDFPYEADDYVHRIGRTGRAGNEGTAISFACEDESFIIPDIETYIGEPLICRQPDEHLFAKLPPPTRNVVSGNPYGDDDRGGHGGGGHGRGGGDRRHGGGGGRGGPRSGGPRRRSSSQHAVGPISRKA